MPSPLHEYTKPFKDSVCERLAKEHGDHVTAEFLRELRAESKNPGLSKDTIRAWATAYKQLHPEYVRWVREFYKPANLQKAAMGKPEDFLGGISFEQLAKMSPADQIQLVITNLIKRLASMPDMLGDAKTAAMSRMLKDLTLAHKSVSGADPRVVELLPPLLRAYKKHGKDPVRAITLLTKLLEQSEPTTDEESEVKHGAQPDDDDDTFPLEDPADDENYTDDIPFFALAVGDDDDD